MDSDGSAGIAYGGVDPADIAVVMRAYCNKSEVWPRTKIEIGWDGPIIRKGCISTAVRSEP